MNIKEILVEEKQIEESFLNPRVSRRANRLLIQLKNKKTEIQSKLEIDFYNEDKTKEQKEVLFAIEKTIPAIEKFRDYFLKLEEQMKDLTDKEKRNKIKKKYAEIEKLFIEKLYNVMSVVGYSASLIIGSAIATIIFLIVVVPGGTLFTFPAFNLIKNLRESKKKIKDKRFEKEIDKLIKKIETKKKTA